MELTAPDIDRIDHRQHFAVGGIVGASALAGLLAYDPDAELPARIIVPIAAAMVAGLAKEAYDYQHPESHTCESGDAIATALGGATVAIAFSVSF